jgi:protein-tyrosine phosphatase
MPAVLFVCTANRFRSPLAEAAFKKCLNAHGSLVGWQVSSAGTWAERGLPPLPSAVLAAKELGLDLERHRSRSVTHELLSSSDLVIVMQASQREALHLEFPQATGKTVLLSELVEDLPYDIPDPFDSMDENHQRIAQEIFDLVMRGYNRIVAAAQTNAELS